MIEWDRSSSAVVLGPIHPANGWSQQIILHLSKKEKKTHCNFIIKQGDPNSNKRRNKIQTAPMLKHNHSQLLREALDPI